MPDLKQAEKKEKELEKRYQERVALQIQRIESEQKEIYSRDKRLIHEEIVVLQEEVQALAAQTQSLEKTLDIASQQPIINPNVADISFLKSLKEAIKNFREKIEDASIWLAAWTQKSKKWAAFWGTATGKKGGAQFLLSSEHYASRSAG